jgi:ubiquinone/menaquinone biosynthesis C-methylase UbiE
MSKQHDFFDFAAEVGLTKHIGGLEASDELFDLCHISKEKYVLDVGCGAGVTPVLLAKRIGCKVVGVDISEGMVRRSRERARREGVADRVEFQVADAQALPFDDNSFDAVITESVTAFPADKKMAVKEYVRVTKPGGYVGLNESTWLKVPPPPELLDWASKDLGANAKPLSSSEWKGLLEAAGLKDIYTRSSEIDLKVEARGVLKRYGFGGMLRVVSRMLSLYRRSPEYRKFVKKVKKEGIAPKNLNEYFGYGLYVGRKQQ